MHEGRGAYRTLGSSWRARCIMFEKNLFRFVFISEYSLQFHSMFDLLFDKWLPLCFSLSTYSKAFYQEKAVPFLVSHAWIITAHSFAAWTCFRWHVSSCFSCSCLWIFSNTRDTSSELNRFKITSFQRTMADWKEVSIWPKGFPQF